MKKTTLTLSALMLLGLSAPISAQVNDVSFIVSPMAGYTFWNKSLNLGDSPFWGVRAGFGIGPIFEVRGVYAQSFDLKGKLQGSGWNIAQNLGDKLNGSKVEMSRVGGELKVNLWNNAVVTPYLTAGAGVLNFKYDDPAQAGSRVSEDQLYGALGGGLKFNLGRRVALSLEATNTLFNVDLENRYLSSDITSAKTLQNWGGQASLDIYLGGRQYATDAVSRAYRRMFSDGFRGMKFVLEPGVAYMRFNSNSKFNDSWLIGGSAGVDLSSIFGLRGFYYRTSDPANKLKLKTSDDLQLFGGNVLARLNVARGVTPYLTLGGGYMQVAKDYVDYYGKTGTTSNGWFAMGGAGLEIPLHRTIALYGQANVMLNEQENKSIGTVYDPSSINVNWLMQAGVRLNFGRKSRSGIDAYEDYAEQRVSYANERNLAEINKLRASYDARISDYNSQINALNSELSVAVANLDTLRVAQLAREKAIADQERKRLEMERIIAQEEALASQQEARIAALERAAQQSTAQMAVPTTDQIVMTEAQLERIVSKVLAATPSAQQSSSKLSDLDKILLIGALRNGQLQPAVAQQIQPLIMPTPQPATTPAYDDKLDLLLRKVETLEARLDNESKEANLELMRLLQQQNAQQTTAPQGQAAMQIITTPQGASQAVSGTPLTSESKINVVELDEKGKAEYYTYSKDEPFLQLSALEPYLGLNFGDATTMVVGIRPYFQMGRSDFHLTPDLFYGFGNGWGISANVVYKPESFVLFNSVRPYAGVGFGHTYINRTSHTGLTGLIGLSLERVLGGKLSVDYTLRPAGHNHQIAVGYTIPL